MTDSHEPRTPHEPQTDLRAALDSHAPPFVAHTRNNDDPLGIAPICDACKENWPCDYVRGYREAQALFLAAAPAGSFAAAAETNPVGGIEHESTEETILAAFLAQGFVPHAGLSYAAHIAADRLAARLTPSTDSPDTLDAAVDRVLEVLTNEGWVADPDATDYNLRVVRLVAVAARLREATDA